MPDNDSMTETTQMAMIGELRKVLKRLHYPLEVMLGVFGVRAQIRRAYGSPGGRGAMHRSEIGV